MQKIIIVEPGSSAIYISDAVKYLGFEPIILCSISEYAGDQKLYIESHGYFEVDAYDVDAIVSCIKHNDIEDIFGIISAADRFIVQACLAAERLNVNGMDPALLKLNDKAKVLNMIPADSPPSAVFKKDNIPVAWLRDCLTLGSVVIKPACSAGAKGLFEIENESQLDNIIELMAREKGVKVLDKEWIAQPNLPGILYSLEGFVIDGRIHHIGFSRRSRIKFTESQNTFPVDDETDPAIISSLQAVLRKLVGISGYKNGYYHTEIIYSNNKAYVIDSNFGRVGGGSVAMQLAQASNKGVHEIYAHVIDVTLQLNKLSCSDFYPREMKKTLSVLYGVNDNLTLVSLDVPNNFHCKHIRFADNGKQVKRVGLDNRSWIGMLIGSPEQVMNEIKQVIIHTDKGIKEPIF